MNKLLEKFSSLVKLTSRFGLISVGKLNYINSFQDYQTLMKLQKLLDTEMSQCFSLTRAYLKTWEPFKDLWKENIDEFMLKLVICATKSNTYVKVILIFLTDIQNQLQYQ